MPQSLHPFWRVIIAIVPTKYLEHYHSERNHQGMGHVIIFPDERLNNDGEVSKSSILGSLLTTSTTEMLRRYHTYLCNTK